jgi:chaperonin cofactor prefoldin
LWHIIPKHVSLTIFEQEFSGLDDDATIYKLVGPVLLKQETAEAKSTVEGRLEYIEKEMYVANFYHTPAIVA